MGQTPIYQLPYPELTDPADVPTDMRELAERTETVFSGLGAGDLTRIADVVLAADAASIDFQNIPQTFAHLMLVIHARTTTAGASDGVTGRFNADASGSYFSTAVRSAGTTPSVVTALSATGLILALVPAAAAAAGADVFGGAVVMIPNYANATLDKNVFCYGGAVTFGTAADMFTEVNTGMWYKPAAITRLTLTSTNGGQLRARSHGTLYGLRGV